MLTVIYYLTCFFCLKTSVCYGSEPTFPDCSALRRWMGSVQMCVVIGGVGNDNIWRAVFPFQARAGSERQPLFLGSCLLFWFFRDSWKPVFLLLTCSISFKLACSAVDGGFGATAAAFSSRTKVLGLIFPSVGAIERIKRRRLPPSTSVLTPVDEEHPRSFSSLCVSGWVSQPPHMGAN